MLALKHSECEYTLRFPYGDTDLYFRGHAVDLVGGRFLQIQFIGSGDGPAGESSRTHHLVKYRVEGNRLEWSTIDPDQLGVGRSAGSAALRAAFAVRMDAPELFGAPNVCQRAEND